MRVNGLILAAGFSSRMGDFKPLMPMGEKTIIESSIQSMLDGGAAHVTLVLGYRAAEVEAVLRGHFSIGQVSTPCNQLYESTDMLASVKIGLAALPACDAFFLLPGDMPAVDRETFLSLHAAMRKTGAKLAIPMIDGHRRHPPLVSAECIPTILSCNGQGGLRQLWQQFEGEVTEVAVDDIGCLLDADTPDDYRRLLRFMQKRQRRPT